MNAIETIEQAIEALEDYYKHTGWESKSTDDLRALLEQMEKQEPVAWMSPGKERLEFSRKDTVYGSHTLPLYKHPVVSQYSVGVIDADGYLYPDHPLEPGTVLYTTPQLPQKEGWQPIETCPPFGFDKDNWFKDGPRYLLWVGHCTIGAYGYTAQGNGRWRNHMGNITPTHWMPLPAAPKPTEDE